MVWLGKKIFEMRQNLSVKRKLIPEDEEKPFLEHLEDLRKTLTRIIATLLVGMIVCFVFREEIFKIVQYPMHRAEIGVMDKDRSPVGLKDPKEWLHVISTAYGLIGLDEAQRATFLSHAFTPETEHLRPVVEAVLIQHAALTLPEASREGYVQAATGGHPHLLAIVQDLQKKKVDVGFVRGPKQMTMRFFKPGEGFNLSMRLSLYAGIVVGFPLLLYFLLEFIVPGLRPEERRVLWPSLAVGFGLFLVGVCFAYFLVTPNALRWLYNYDLTLGAVTEYRLSDYASFVVQFTLIFGLCFELPVIVYALNKLGILSYDLMKNTRSYAIIIIVVIAALITPTADLLNLALLAVPMVFLYEISIWIAYFHDKAQQKREAAEEAEDRAARQARRERAAMAGAYLDAPAPAHADPDVYDSHHHHDHYDHHGHPESEPHHPPFDPDHPPADQEPPAPDAASTEYSAPDAPHAAPSLPHTPGEPSEESRRHRD